MVRGQVLHQHKGHARIGDGGHGGKEGLEGRQPPAEAPMPTMGKCFSGGFSELSGTDFKSVPDNSTLDSTGSAIGA